LATVSAYLENTLGYNDQTLAPDQILSVTYTNDGANVTAYWYYLDDSKPTRQWGRSRLTGNLSGLTVKDYTTESDKQGLAYSISYINA